jgi:uncharacterized protein
MKAEVKRHLTIVAGWIFLFLGFMGLFLPVLQGVLFIIIGLYMLSREIPWVARLLEGLKKRYPKLNKVMETAEIKIKKWSSRFLHREQRKGGEIMKRNIGTGDRIIRALVGLGITGLALYEKSWFMILGILIMLTSLFGWCGLYSLLHINTITKPKAPAQPAK